MGSLVITGQTVAVLGASGFIGSYLVDALLAKGCNVRAICRRFPGLISPGSVNHPLLEQRSLDFCDPVGLSKSMEGVDICFLSN